MSKINDGGSAFPCTASDLNNPVPGMSLRAWFAGQALAGMLAYGNHLDLAQIDNGGPGVARRVSADIANLSVRIADAMIARLAEVPE